MRKLLALALMCFAAHLAAQMPKAPEHMPRLDRAEWAFLAVDGGVRCLDVYSTHKALHAGNKEGTLPGWIANHTAVMALYSGSIVAGQYYMARRLAPRHRTWAHLLTAADIYIDARPAIHNLFLPGRAPVYAPKPVPFPVSIPD